MMHRAWTQITGVNIAEGSTTTITDGDVDGSDVDTTDPNIDYTLTVPYY